MICAKVVGFCVVPSVFGLSVLAGFAVKFVCCPALPACPVLFFLVRCPSCVSAVVFAVGWAVFSVAVVSFRQPQHFGVGGVAWVVACSGNPAVLCRFCHQGLCPIQRQNRRFCVVGAKRGILKPNKSVKGTRRPVAVLKF